MYRYEKQASSKKQHHEVNSSFEYSLDMHYIIPANMCGIASVTPTVNRVFYLVSPRNSVYFSFIELLMDSSCIFKSLLRDRQGGFGINIAATGAQTECNITWVWFAAWGYTSCRWRACYLLFAARWSPSIRGERQSTSEFFLSPFSGLHTHSLPASAHIWFVRGAGSSVFGPKQLRSSPCGASLSRFPLLDTLFLLAREDMAAGILCFSFMGRDVAPAPKDGLCHKGM